jgi:hypothetical protein
MNSRRVVMTTSRSDRTIWPIIIRKGANVIGEVCGGLGQNVQSAACSRKIMVSAGGSGIVFHAGALVVTQTLRATGLDRGLAVGTVAECAEELRGALKIPRAGGRGVSTEPRLRPGGPSENSPRGPAKGTMLTARR